MNSEKKTEQEIIEIIKRHKKINIKKTFIYKIIAVTSLTTICAIFSLYFGKAFFFSKIIQSRPGQTTSQPCGDILATTALSPDGRKISVIAETRNIKPGQYLWIAVDRPELGLCWPKLSRIDPNIKFKTIIHEGGPKGLFAISLYAVTKTTNNQWQEWLDDKKFGGLPMLPDKKRLDTVRLILQ